MVALEDRFQTRIDEGRFSEAASVADLKRLVEAPAARADGVEEPVDFPSWNRTLARASRSPAVAGDVDRAADARFRARARRGPASTCAHLDGPVVFASNHQSHMDVPVILSALPGRWRARVAPAMAKEFFKAHFFPARPHVAGAVHQLAQLLPGRVLLQRLPAAAARGRRAPDAAVHRRADRRRAGRS